MKKFALIFSVLLSMMLVLFLSNPAYAKFGLGLPGVIKERVKELDKKVEEKKAESSSTIEQTAAAILETQNLGRQYFEELESQDDPDALQKTVDYLKAQPNVDDAGVGGDGVSICIKYESGVEGMILTKSFGSLSDSTASAPSYRSNLQKLQAFNIGGNALSAPANKKAIILLPVDSEPNYEDISAADISKYLQQSGYFVEIYRDEAVTVDLMKTLSNYNFVYMGTHGGLAWIWFGGVEIMTGEVANSGTIFSSWDELKARITSGLMIMSPPKSRKSYFGLNKNFFDDYTYPGTFVYMNACSSLKNNSLADAFLNNGASVYLGWNNVSFLALGNLQSPQFFQELSKPNNTLQQAYTNTLAKYYPATVYKDDDKDGNYRALLKNGEDLGEEELDDTTVDYSLSLNYKGDPGFILNFQQVTNDNYEPDNTYTQAKTISNGSRQTHSIIPANDIDWVKFTLSETADVVIETSGPGEDDTRMWLYNASGVPNTEIEYNDDRGTDWFSKITKQNLPAGTYYVKIDEFENDNEIGTYYIDLTATTPTGEITVTSPDGVESWERGNSRTITWTSSNAGSNVKIELHKGGNYQSTITSSTSNDGSYSWAIPGDQTTGSDYKIKITDTSNSSVYDYSNSYFSITEESSISDGTMDGIFGWNVQATIDAEPNSGPKGTPATVTITFSGGANLVDIIETYQGGEDIEFHHTPNVDPIKQSANVWQAIGSLTGAAGVIRYYALNAGGQPTAVGEILINGGVTVPDWEHDGIYDEVSSLTVTSPDGGESGWWQGTSRTITWTSSNAGSNVKIELYKGGNYQGNITSSTSNDGSYSWAIPGDQTTGSDYKIKITDTSNSSVWDESNNYFSITTFSYEPF